MFAGRKEYLWFLPVCSLQCELFRECADGSSALRSSQWFEFVYHFPNVYNVSVFRTELRRCSLLFTLLQRRSLHDHMSSLVFTLLLLIQVILLLLDKVLKKTMNYCLSNYLASKL